MEICLINAVSSLSKTIEFNWFITSLNGQRQKNICSYLLLYLGLLDFNGPPRPLLVNGDENEDDDCMDEEDEREEQPRVENRAIAFHSSSSVEENTFEHLPPRLHQGNSLVHPGLCKTGLLQS